MDFQALLANEHGLWAIAPYFRACLIRFTVTASEDAKRDLGFLVKSLDHILTDDGGEVERTPELRHVMDQLLYQAQLHDAPCCELSPFRQWLSEADDLRSHVYFTVAFIDFVQDEFVWSVTTEIQELRSIRKALLANWRMLTDLHRQSDTGNPEDQTIVAGVEENVRMMLERATTLLRTYNAS